MQEKIVEVGRLKRVERFFSSCKHWFILRRVIKASAAWEIVREYAEKPAVRQENIGRDCRIWVCWWQGEDAMPELVRACLRTVRLHACGHPVTVVSKDNFCSYVELPEFILSKVERGVIDLTKLSDVLRCALIKRHGGIWIDSTIFLTRDVDDFIFVDRPFWTYRTFPTTNNVSMGNWTGNFWAAGRGNVLASFLLDFHYSYWERNDRVLTYLLPDYGFVIGWKYVGVIRSMVEAVPRVNKDTVMKHYLNKPFDEEEWSCFVNEFVYQKLAYKMELERWTVDGRLTHYGRFLELYGGK